MVLVVWYFFCFDGVEADNDDDDEADDDDDVGDDLEDAGVEDEDMDNISLRQLPTSFPCFPLSSPSSQCLSSFIFEAANRFLFLIFLFDNNELHFLF